jgi:hypothetical protein
MTASLKGITLGPAQISGFTALTLFMTLGFGASLLPMRFVLRSKAGVTGRLGMLAGFSSPIVLLALEMLHGSPVSHSVNYTFAFLAGSVTTVALFAPRISIISARNEPDPSLRSG